MVPSRVSFFYLGGYVKKGLNLGSNSEERVPFG